MILYNASTSDGLRNFTRSITNTNTSTYSNADLDAALNSYYDTFVTDILAAMDEWDFQAEYATTSLVTNQQEYVLPTDILKIKRVEITYDGATWYEVRPEDVNERSATSGSVTDINSDYSTGDPRYDLMDNSLFLKPVPTGDVTAGLKVWYEKLPTFLSAATDEPSFSRPFHKGLAYGAAKDYFEKYLEKKGFTSKLSNADANLNRYISKMKEFYRDRNQDRHYIVSPQYINFDYGNDY